jgi:hypothetical protein
MLKISQPASDRIETRVVPPSRKSIRQSGDENPCGPHQRITCSASLHACQTRSTGASNLRVTIMSWVLLSVDISFVLLVTSRGGR